MSSIQKFFSAILPARWVESMRAESEQWKLKCPCGHVRSVWEAGGIRWKAKSTGKKIRQKCPQCDEVKWAAVERDSP